MALVSRRPPREEPSPRAFAAEVRSLLERAALEDFAKRLDATGPIPVRRMRYTTFASRVRLQCLDGGALELRIYWPRHGPIDTLESIRFDDRVGWIVRTRSAGAPVVLYAWLGRYEPAPD